MTASAEKVSAVVRITNAKGLHARAAAKFVQAVCEGDADVQVTRNGGPPVSGRSIMGLMMLAASRGSEVKITASGKDADDTLRRLVKLVENKFDED